MHVYGIYLFALLPGQYVGEIENLRAIKNLFYDVCDSSKHSSNETSASAGKGPCFQIYFVTQTFPVQAQNGDVPHTGSPQ